MEAKGRRNQTSMPEPPIISLELMSWVKVDDASEGFILAWKHIICTDEYLYLKQTNICNSSMRIKVVFRHLLGACMLGVQKGTILLFILLRAFRIYHLDNNINLFKINDLKKGLKLNK